MKQHEIEQLHNPSNVELNALIKSREENGWELITPISFHSAIFNEFGLVTPLVAFLTFSKEVIK